MCSEELGQVFHCSPPLDFFFGSVGQRAGPAVIHPIFLADLGYLGKLAGPGLSMTQAYGCIPGLLRHPRLPLFSLGQNLALQDLAFLKMRAGGLRAKTQERGLAEASSGCCAVLH